MGSVLVIIRSDKSRRSHTTFLADSSFSSYSTNCLSTLSPIRRIWMPVIFWAWLCKQVRVSIMDNNICFIFLGLSKSYLCLLFYEKIGLEVGHSVPSSPMRFYSFPIVKYVLPICVCSKSKHCMLIEVSFIFLDKLSSSKPN